VARPFRLNLPAPAAVPPPDLDDPAHAHSAAEGPGVLVAPMPGR